MSRISLLFSRIVAVDGRRALKPFTYTCAFDAEILASQRSDKSGGSIVMGSCVAVCSSTFLFPPQLLSLYSKHISVSQSSSYVLSSYNLGSSCSSSTSFYMFVSSYKLRAACCMQLSLKSCLRISCT